MRTHTSTLELCKYHAYRLQHQLYSEGNAGHIEEQATAQGDCAMFGHAPAEVVMHVLEDVPTPELTPEQEQMKARIEQILEDSPAPAKTITMIGKMGPAFGDRPSFVELEALENGCTVIQRVANWPAHDRRDSLRAAFDGISRVFI